MNIYQLHIQLLGIKPPTWRRIQASGNVTLYRLNLLIQRTMGWKNSHLSQFEIDGDQYGYSEYDDYGGGTLDFKKFKLSQVVSNVGQKFLFVYDFGDDWEHQVTAENIFPPEKRIKYPRCIDGARACPPEDIGSIYGYPEFLEAISDPRNEKYEEMLEWAGEFDPERFDKDEATRLMQKR